MRLFPWGIVLTYLFIGVTIKLSGSREVFPFFTWELYSEAPQDISSDYAIFINKDEDLIGSAILQMGGVSTHSIVQAIGEKVTDGQKLSKVPEFQVLRTKFLKSQSQCLNLVIVKRTYNILKRYHTGIYQWQNLDSASSCS